MSARTFDADYLVIGTGPTAVAAISKLIESGRKIYVIDAGSTDNTLRRNQFKLKEETKHLKSFDGSYDDYFAHEYSSVKYEDGLIARASNFPGGFSRVWGATHAGFDSSYDWPINAIPSKSDQMGLDAIMKQTQILPTLASEKIREKFDQVSIGTWTSMDAYSASAHEHISNSQTLVQSTLENQKSSSSTNENWQSFPLVIDWVNRGKIKLYSENFVLHCGQYDERVVVQAVDKNGIVNVFTGKRLILAAGPIGTAQILVQSKILKSLEVLDCPTAFGGFVTLNRKSSNSVNSSMNSQWWAQEKDVGGLFAQFYQPSVLNQSRIHSELPIFLRLKVISRWLASHTVPIVIYSPQTNAESLRITKNSADEITIESNPSVEMRAEFKSRLKDLAKLLRKAGFIAAPAGFRIANTGSGFHSGCSLPLNKRTSRLGCLPGLDRIHIVDTSVLPHLKVGPITTIAMLNAIRISTEVIGTE